MMDEEKYNRQICTNGPIYTTYLLPVHANFCSFSLVHTYVVSWHNIVPPVHTYDTNLNYFVPPFHV